MDNIQDIILAIAALLGAGSGAAALLQWRNTKRQLDALTKKTQAETQQIMADVSATVVKIAGEITQELREELARVLKKVDTLEGTCETQSEIIKKLGYLATILTNHLLKAGIEPPVTLSDLDTYTVEEWEAMAAR